MAKKTAEQTINLVEQESTLSPMQGASLIEAMLPEDIDDDFSGKGEADDGEKEEEEGEEQEGEEQEGEEQEGEEEEGEEEEGEEEEGEEEDEDDEGSDDELTFEVTKADGTKEEVGEKEMLDGYLRQADYTRKTQKLAEDRKATEAVAAEADAARGNYAQQLEALKVVMEKALPQEPDWDTLRRDNPTEYARQFTDWQLQQSNLKKVDDEQVRVAAEAQAAFGQKLAAHMEVETKALRAAIPEFQDAKKAKALTEKLVEYGVEQAHFTKDEIGQALDHRVLIMLNKARLYDELQAKKPKIRAKTKRAKTLKPGTRKEPGRKAKLRVKKAVKRARRTGRPEDAASAIERLLPDDVF